MNKMSQTSTAPLVMNEISHVLRAILVMNYKIMEMDNSISIIFLPKSNDF